MSVISDMVPDKGAYHAGLANRALLVRILHNAMDHCDWAATSDLYLALVKTNDNWWEQQYANGILVQTLRNR